MGKPYEIGSPEAKAVIQRIREQESRRPILDAYGHDSFRNVKRVTPELKARVAKMIEDGTNHRDIARQVGISYSTVARIATGVR